MKTCLSMLVSVILIALLALNIACAEEAINTTVTMRVSHLTQSAVVDAGEDLSIEVNIDGVDADRYQWYFNDEAIEGENQKVINIVNVQPENAGIYRMDAFGADGAMLVSMDIAARVVEPDVPQSGDSSLPVGAAFAGMALCAAAMALLLRRRAML